MSVTIIKPKLKDESVIQTLELITPEEVDEFATISAKLKRKQEKLAPLIKRVAAYEKDILGTVDDIVDAAHKITLTGIDYELQLGAKGNKTSITNMELAVDFLGEELFLKIAKITMKDLQAYLTPEQLEQVTASERSTKRRVKIETI